MKIPFTYKTLKEWAGDQTFHDAKLLAESKKVSKVHYEHPFIYGELALGPRGMRSKFELFPDGLIGNHCPCRGNRERGQICSHIIALGIALIRQNSDPERKRKAFEESRRAKRLAEIDESRYLTRVKGNSPGSLEAQVELSLRDEWRSASRGSQIPLSCRIITDEGAEKPEDIPTDKPLAFDQSDENLLYVLEDIAQGPIRSEIEMNAADFINILEIQRGKTLLMGTRSKPASISKSKVSSFLQTEFDEETGHILVHIYTELPIQNNDLPVYIISGQKGWLYSTNTFWEIKNVLPLPLQEIYTRAVEIERPMVPSFFKTELPMLKNHISVVEAIPESLFSFVPATPQMQIIIKGSPGAVTAKLFAKYDQIRLPAKRPHKNGHFAIPDPDDLLCYFVRNKKSEEEALARLEDVGFYGKHGEQLSSISGQRAVSNFLGSGLPAIRRMGWDVTLEGPVQPFLEEAEFATPVVHIDDSSSNKWFEVNFDFEDMDGASISPAAIQQAILKNESYINHKGRTILIDSSAINEAREVFSDCSSSEGSQAGSFRLDNIYGAYVQSSLDTLDGIDVESTPSWLTKARQNNRAEKMQPVQLGSDLEETLRPYQKEGLSWMRFLENIGCGGILADEMGLGKTVQTLSWIQMKRLDPEAQGKPSLIVCPTSLVENWAEEAQKFTPDLEVLVISGPDRQECWSQIGDANMVVTSYALLRRDVDEYLEHEFAIIALDEAQHIKNRTTQNSVATKSLSACHRLVLTGTPIENSVADLWSIMDFLMPRYLGGHKQFRENYELPISRGGPEAELAQLKLRRKLHPFLLRRLKRDVAKDLPAKIQKTVHCHLTSDQQMVYREMLKKSQRKISNLVSKQGFNKSRMEIFKTLLRLRQICCHLDLLKLDNLNSRYPSGKMDIFFELLDEALDSNHRILVFSQFTSMLAILRRELEKRELSYCYLDGSTKKRQKIVSKFNTDHTIPIFLISLKAGGHGLNLTGADMVIHFDPWWNPAVEDQATDRAHRIGQKKTVYSVKLITQESIEEKVLEMQERKRRLIDATMEKDTRSLDKMDWNSVKKLLDM